MLTSRIKQAISSVQPFVNAFASQVGDSPTVAVNMAQPGIPHVRCAG